MALEGRSYVARQLLFWVAIALAVAEFIDSFFIDAPVFAIIYAILIAASAWWLRSRAGRTPTAVLLVLGALELISVIFIYPNSDDPPAAWNLAIFGILTSAVVILAAVSLFGGGASTKTEQNIEGL